MAAALIPLIYAATCRFLLNPDPFLYAQCAKEFLGGARLYSQTWQDRPPFGLLWYAIPQLFVARSYIAIQIFLGLWLVAEGMLFVFFSDVSWLGRLACYFFLTLFPLTGWDYAWASTEHAANLFVAINLLLAYLIRRRGGVNVPILIAIGAVTCIAFHVRQSALLSIIVPLTAVVMLHWGKPLQIAGSLLWIGVGGFGMWGIVLGMMAWFGDLGGYLFTTFTYVRLFAAQDLHESRVDLLVELLLTGLPTLAAIFFWTAFRRQAILSSIAVAVGVASCMSSPRDHAHYWVQLFPYLALLIAISFPRGSVEATPWRQAAIFALVFGTISGSVPYLYRSMRSLDRDFLSRVVRRIDSAAGPEDTLFVLGQLGPASYVQFVSRVKAANKFYCCWQLDAPRCDIMPRPLKDITADYLKSPPTILAIEADDWNQIQAYRRDSNVSLSNSAMLTAMLIQRNHYRSVGTAGGFIVLQKPSGASSTGRS